MLRDVIGVDASGFSASHELQAILQLLRHVDFVAALYVVENAKSHVLCAPPRRF